jgi:hypothetical protein
LARFVDEFRAFAEAVQDEAALVEMMRVIGR